MFRVGRKDARLSSLRSRRSVRARPVGLKDASHAQRAHVLSRKRRQCARPCAWSGSHAVGRRAILSRSAQLGSCATTDEVAGPVIGDFCPPTAVKSAARVHETRCHWDRCEGTVAHPCACRRAQASPTLHSQPASLVRKRPMLRGWLHLSPDMRLGVGWPPPGNAQQLRPLSCLALMRPAELATAERSEDNRQTSSPTPPVPERRLLT
jgi:hypothetical protein